MSDGMYALSEYIFSRRLIGRGCLGLLGIILVAGLWPFHAPKNNVAWLPGRGLHFGRYGSAVSRSEFAARAANDATGSLEVWLRPAAYRRRVILSFETPSHPLVPFLLRQNKDGLVVQEPNKDANGVYRTAWLSVDQVFRGEQPVLVTVTMQPSKTQVYVDGALVKSFSLAGTSGDNFSGKLVLANSATVSDAWAGDIDGLAVYRRDLSSSQVAADYESWSNKAAPELAESKAPVAFYAFDEGSGAVAHNRVDAATDLMIPRSFFVLHPAFLESTRGEYRPTLSYWQDTLVNVLGFIPFGFCLAAYFSRSGGKRAVAMAVSMGFLTSLTIELLQFLLPTRSSGTTDLITNTLGTAIGALLFHQFFLRQWSIPAGDFIRTPEKRADEAFTFNTNLAGSREPAETNCEAKQA